MPKDGVTGQIDRLVLDISVKDGSGDGSKSSAQKISALDKALQNFTKTVKGIDTKGFGRKFASMTNSLNPFVKKIRAAQAELSKLNRLTKSTGTQAAVNAAGSGKLATRQEALEDKANGSVPAAQSGKGFATRSQRMKEENLVNNPQNIAELGAQYGKLKKQITDANGATTLFYETYDKTSRITKKFTAQLDQQGKVISGSFKQVNTTADNVAGDGLKAFFLSIRRIALYRAIRFSLKVITQMFKEGIANMAKFDDTTRHAMSEISSSFTVIKNSVALVFKPIIEMVAPFIRTLAKQIGEIANAISYQTAKLRGQGKVLKVNTEYFEEMNKQSHLLDFDQFSVLSNMDSTNNMFEEVPIEEMDQYYEDHKGILETVKAIEIAIGAIAGYKIVKWIMGGGIGKLYNSISPMAIAIGGIVMAIESIHDILNWDEMTTGAQKFWNVLTTIFATIAAIAGVVAAFLPTGAAKIAKAIAFGAFLAGGVSMIVGKAQAHADGGMFEGTGTMYHLAGESGAEIVASGSRGTGVTNIAQFKTAMVQALAEYGVARQDSSGRPLVVELDGKEIARSQVYNNANELMRNYNLVLKPR